MARAPTWGADLAKKTAEAHAIRVVDLVLSPFVYLCAQLLKLVRMAGVENLPHSKSALQRAGCFPIWDHYYEPAFQNEHLRAVLSKDRHLPGIDWNRDEQLAVLSSFSNIEELETLRHAKGGDEATTASVPPPERADCRPRSLATLPTVLPYCLG